VLAHYLKYKSAVSFKTVLQSSEKVTALL